MEVKHFNSFSANLEILCIKTIESWNQNSCCVCRKVRRSLEKVHTTCVVQFGVYLEFQSPYHQVSRREV